MKALRVKFLLWAHGVINGLLEKYDLCYICRDRADSECEDCGGRICAEHDSFFYEDHTLCTKCEEKITPEERSEMRKEGIAFNCETDCHSQGCVCTRPHIEHDENCSLCTCATNHECGPDSNCTPTGYRYRTEVA